MTASVSSGAKYKHLGEPIHFETLVDVDIHQPGQYMGHELGVEEKNWHESNVRWVLSYPETYQVGASNLGHIILYSILNTIPGQICDRAYLPGIDLAQRLREKSIPLFAVESRCALKNFDIVGFSLSYELGATNILEMLDLAGIDLYSNKRKDLPLNDPSSLPLIFAGGPTATSNPEPYANFFDFFALGDGEELLPEIGLIIAQSKKLGVKRSQALLNLAEIPGVYVPSLYQQSKDCASIKPSHTSAPKRIIRRVAQPIPYYSMGLVSNVETVHDRLTIEIRRGCTRGCRFCQPGMLTRPARDVEPKEVIEAVENGMKKTGYSDFSLLSLSCSDYLSLPEVGVELRNRLGEKNITLQLPSQRVDRFDDNIAHILGGSRQAGLTFAPEAGTQRLRNIINKGLTNDELLNGIRKAMEHQYKKVKLYFMIGLPGELDEDIQGIAQTCKWLQEQCQDIGRLKLNITISNFTPKPHTPFQWHSVATTELLRRQQILKDAISDFKIRNIKVNFTDVRISAIEDFLGRGDRRLGSVIESAWRSGAGMDAWFESQDRAYNAWTTAISKAGFANELRKLEMGNWGNVKTLDEKNDLINFCAQPLPWDHIDTGIDKDWLIKDLQQALNATVVPDCSFYKCSSCGVCGPELGHNKVITPTSIPPIQDSKLPQTQKACRIRIQFEKAKPMHLISHLDLIRLLERALRRSNLPISYTGGFHPLPRLQVALALPLGIEGLGEWMDMDFFEDINATSMKDELQKYLPKGIKLIQAQAIPVSKTSLSQELVQANWSFKLENSSKQKPESKKWVDTIQTILNSKELIWIDKDKKGRKRERDFRPELKSLFITKFQSDKSNSKQIISIELKSLISPIGKSIKPIHVKHWLEKATEKELKITDIQRNELVLKKC
ncbi:TIGR03960 family B12-binding radical SAM protein [Prochlorococcus marinus]|uniref:SAM radical enzyme n=1 Tax=Prochlorococcus marinus (strain SARG / CCMP1375 / SS120) TaxID=167539 RepID=Q7VA13_PROMA|nr:TIGR03960 family B12-binding radical SAM protein [Prochlorococcus marinus]AAQ00700.1 SAM radical enzyme [Prochlorococcus marinus subsp. marinus str. CCMP1375]